jgi:hypothetical protein
MVVTSVFGDVAQDSGIVLDLELNEAAVEYLTFFFP